VGCSILDTGILVEHTEFEGRATFGFATKGLQKVDCDGHGTHCAGTAAGKTFGVAKNANLIAVKVLGDDGLGKALDIAEGIRWCVRFLVLQFSGSLVTGSSTKSRHLDGPRLRL
jgi:subtilisin family serine protease